MDQDFRDNRILHKYLPDAEEILEKEVQERACDIIIQLLREIRAAEQTLKTLKKQYQKILESSLDDIELDDE